MPKKYVKVKPGHRKGMNLLDPAERGALRILERIDRHIEKVDAARIRLRMDHIGSGKRLLSHNAPLYSPQEESALSVLRLMRKAKIRCAKCGNNRLKVPDLNGKCRVCKLKRGAANKKRLRHTPKAKAARRAARSRHRARLRNAPINDLTAKGEAWAFRLYGTKCLRCGAEPVALDHVVPLASGGPHTASNLQPLCWVCNSSKCARSCADYRPFPYYPEIQ